MSEEKLWALAFVWLIYVSVFVIAALRPGDTPFERDSMVTLPLSLAESGRAKSVYSSSCASCHGARLEGGDGPPLAEVGSHHSLEEIEMIIGRGKGGKGELSTAGHFASKYEANLLARWLILQSPWTRPTCCDSPGSEYQSEIPDLMSLGKQESP